MTEPAPAPGSAAGPILFTVAALTLVVGLAAFVQGDFDRSAGTSAPQPSAAAAETSTTVAPTTTTAVTAPSSTLAFAATLAPIDELAAGDVESALTDAGFPGLDVAIDDTTLTVSGTVADDVIRRAVLAQLSGIEGVTELIDDLTTG